MKRKVRRFLSFFPLLAALVFSGRALAASLGGLWQQEHPRGEGHHQMHSPEDRLKMLTKELNLTTDQQAKIKSILEDEHKKMEEAHDTAGGSREQMFEKMKQIHQDTSSQIRSALDDKQKKQFDEMESQRQKRWEKKPQGKSEKEPGAGFNR